MSLENFISVVSRLFFLGAFVLFGITLIERIANVGGYTVLQGKGSHLLDITLVLLAFVIAAQLREMKEAIKRKL